MEFKQVIDFQGQDLNTGERRLIYSYLNRIKHQHPFYETDTNIYITACFYYKMKN